MRKRTSLLTITAFVDSPFQEGVQDFFIAHVSGIPAWAEPGLAVFNSRTLVNPTNPFGILKRDRSDLRKPSI